MLAQRLHTFGGDLVLETIPEPRPGPAEVLVRVDACGVGQSVLNAIGGRLARRPELPLVPGHEIAGTVVEVDSDTSGIEVGTRVVTYFYVFCGTCGPCMQDAQQFCVRHEGQVGIQRNGGYAELVSLPARLCIPIDDSISAVDATVIPDAVATPVHVCSSLVRVGDKVAVVGAGGGVGVHMLQVAQLRGAEAVGIEANAAKLRAIEKWTGCRTLRWDSARESPERFDVVIDLVGQPETFQWALRTLGNHGRLVLLTMASDRPLEVDVKAAVSRELQLVASRYASVADVALAARLVASGRVRPVVSEARPLADVATLHDLIRAGELVGRGAVETKGQGS